ncbi:MAG: DUF3489 domain-containing protein [Alphaproteobacteria bacterium]|jgi:glutaminase|nr:DUF3489 domain-containing protein [Alphaproteobacteria bacterium]
MSKKASKTGKSRPKAIVKAAIKKKAQSNGKPTNDEALSAPMQAGLAAVAAMKPTNDAPARETKLLRVIELLSRPEGATIDQIVEATGWQKHTARAALSHALRKKRGYQIVSDKPKDGKRVYKIAPPRP